ncbi:MAG: hypothetical protein ABEK04_00395 [Candidatus Nanohalobium sp.]
MTAVLITGIVMGGIGTVYLWGVPMLEKRQVTQEVAATEEDVRNLYNKIVSTSEQGSGASATISVEADSITVNPREEYIQIRNELDEPAKRGFTWSLLKGSSFQNISIGAGKYGVKGEELPGVIAFKSVAGQGSSEITYRVEFRNLCSKSTGKLSKIDLKVNGKRRAAGSATIRITNKGEEVDSNVVMPEGECEGRTSRVNTVIQVGLE